MHKAKPDMLINNTYQPNSLKTVSTGWSTIQADMSPTTLDTFYMPGAGFCIVYVNTQTVYYTDF